MSQFRTTADILDLALTNAGEVTNGNSPYESQLLNYLNRVHYTLIAGGTIPIGKDQTLEIDETWPWSRAKTPISLDLQPAITTGTITLTNGSVSGTFSSAPASSVEGWFLKVPGSTTVYRVGHHGAGNTAFSIESEFLGTGGSGLSYTLYKLDYEIIPGYIVTNAENQYIQFQEVAGTTITGTLTYGVRTPSAHISHVVSVMNAAGGTPVYTGSYDSTTRKFTIASDRGGGAVFVLVGTGSQSAYSQHATLGFDDSDTTNAASVTSTYPLGGICRLIEPFKLTVGGSIYGCDAESFQRDYPLSLIGSRIPDRFCIVREDSDGRIVVRFNGYPSEEKKVYVEYVPVPRDLKDSSASIPIVPRKHIDVLEDAATFYLMLNKNDDRMQIYAGLAQGKLKAMVAQHRGQLLRAGKSFGQVIPRRDNTDQAINRLQYGYTAGDE